MATARKKSSKKKPTLRQRLRADAEKKLNSMCEHLSEMFAAEVDMASRLDSTDVMRLICGNQTKSIRDKLIGQLANEAEDELEKIYNNQILLDLAEKPDGD